MNTDITATDFSMFGIEPQSGGQFIDVSVGSPDADGYVKDIVFQYPNGRIGSLMISHLDPPSEFEAAQLNLLIKRCGEGSYTLEGLAQITSQETYAWALIIDAIAAGAA